MSNRRCLIIISSAIDEECKLRYNSIKICKGVIFMSTFSMEGHVFRLKNQEIFNNLAQPKTYKKGQIIYNQGDDAEYVYYLINGKVQIYVGSSSGAEKILATFSGGSMFGKSAFFDKLPRASCARALAKSEIIPVDMVMMADVISNYPHFALDMLEYLSKTIRMFSNQIENISFLQADKRVAMFIISHLSDGANTIQCTHDEISSTISASRVTVSKVLSQFVSHGWVDTGYGTIRVLDLDGLKAFATLY